MKLLAIVLLALCQESPFYFPQTDTTPQPAPPVEPRPVTVLPEDSFFVVESDVKAFVLHSPDGLLSVTEEAGPIKLRGKFAGGSGKVETKTFSKPFVYTIEGVKTGQCELILIPTNCTDSGQIKRLVLSVNGAQPPPDDGKKDPQPGPTPHSGLVHVDVVEDVTNRTADTAIVLNKLATWEAFSDAGNSYTIRDKDSAAAKLMAQEYAGNDLPAVIIRDKATKKPLRVMPLPKEFETLQRLVNELGGK